MKLGWKSSTRRMIKHDHGLANADIRGEIRTKSLWTCPHICSDTHTTKKSNLGNGTLKSHSTYFCSKVIIGRVYGNTQEGLFFQKRKRPGRRCYLLLCITKAPRLQGDHLGLPLKHWVFLKALKNANLQIVHKIFKMWVLILKSWINECIHQNPEVLKNLQFTLVLIQWEK